MGAPKHNLFALGNNGGRPKIYEDPLVLEQQCEQYFLWCIENKVNLTITGLGLYLGFSCRETINEYAQRQEFSAIIKRAKFVVENSYEQNLDTFKYGGAIFALKNMGWKDQVDQNITQTITNVTPQVIESPVKLSGSEQDVVL